MIRYLAWFSAGCPSAVTAKLALAEYGHDNVSIFYTDPGSEHPDNRRFIADCEKWFDHPVSILKSEQYESTWDVWEKTRFLVGPMGARCTTELKKKLRWGIEANYDYQLYGYTSDSKDAKRADRFRKVNLEVKLVTPLIDRGLTKADCKALVERAGIRLPVMYELGYENNNCIGCVKGGMGYWNKIRRDFPDKFERMSDLERDIGHSVCSDDDGPVWLDELDPARGNYKDEPEVECSLLCAIAEADMDGAA